MNTVDSYRLKFKGSLPAKERTNTQVRCLRIVYKSLKTYTWFVWTSARSIPDAFVIDSQGKISGDCWLGVNWREIVVLREGADKPAVSVPLEDSKLIQTTISLFIQSEYYQRASVQTPEEKDSRELRFDGKMLYNFSDLVGLYRSIRKTFP